MSALRRLAPPALIALLGLLLLGPGLPRAERMPADAGRGTPARPVADTARGGADRTLGGLERMPAEAPTPAPLPVTPPPRGKILAPDILIQGSGWGHSVGLSQYGARAQAMAGRSHKQILSHYFPGVRIGTLRNAPPPIRVGLFSDRAVDATRVQLQTTSRDGRAPTRNATVDLGSGPIPMPHGQTWELRAESAGLVLYDGAGKARGEGPGPAVVAFSFLKGHPTLLRLPQVGQSYQWGAVEVHRVGGTLQPVLVAPLELYLRGIAEVPSDWHHEALRAQAVTARTYALRQLQRGAQPGCLCHLGSTPLHQAYAGWAKEAGAHGSRWVGAVDATANQVVTWQGKLAWTYFSSSHGGRSENVEESWAFPNAIPYLRGVDDSWSNRPEAGNPNALWRRVIPNARFAAALGAGLREVRGIRVLSRTGGGTPRELEITGLDAKGAPKTVRWKGAKKGIAGADLKLLFRAELPSQQILSLGLAPFVDDDGLPQEHDIAVAHAAGVIGPCDAPTLRFCPAHLVRRGEAAELLGRAAGVPAPLSQPEAALTRGGWAELLRAAMRLDEAAVTAAIGCAADACPPDPITRAELATLLRQALRF